VEAGDQFHTSAALTLVILGGKVGWAQRLFRCCGKEKTFLVMLEIKQCLSSPWPIAVLIVHGF
jgi:hypothetical protein